MYDVYVWEFSAGCYVKVARVLKHRLTHYMEVLAEQFDAVSAIKVL